MNAFDIISISSGLDLSGLFEPASHGKRERKFTSTAAVEEVEERVVEVGGRLGYRVEREKGGAIGLVKGRTVLLAEILEVAPEFVMVVVKVVDCGGGVVEFEEVYWDDLRVGFEGIGLSWHNDDVS
ncbi:CBL-interacting serine/threonine-protein kinase 15 [Camellia lanceoleosa]|uniref:CBL-interacting serine/threonine-protein kinase 15 n=1 Tax=Camellia lanceoleosa TaxID=1840588 RepID=A0ACC0GU64_9ERIC|nr:CBL-interacting serine/threonine-protein kinase 15 [Camellia lanceoleosa]